MKSLALPAALALGIFALAGVLAQAEERMLAHDVYFSLKDPSPQAKEKFIASCKKYLSDHPGTVWFAAGPLAEELKREVNDLEFDVALHIVFKNKAAHDQYQTAEKHLKFIAENKENFKKVRVFDSYVAASAHGETGGMPGVAAKAPLPEAALGFAGMIQGKVVETRDGQIVVEVTGVLKEWKHSKAKHAKGMIGKTIPIEGREGNIARFVKLLKVGEEVELDVAQKNNAALTILELTEPQRQRVKP